MRAGSIESGERTYDLDDLRSPGGAERLLPHDGRLRSESGEEYAVVRGVPILLSPERSVFEVQAQDDAPSPRPRLTTRVATAIQRVLPSPSRNVTTRANYGEFARRLTETAGTKRVLVIGGGSLGEGLDAIIDHPDLDFVETDVYLGPRTHIVCDGHDLPFADGAFDGVVCQAVLEHVIDPVRVVQEIHRVLKPSGLVYSEIPFIQQVHGAPYDFTRFTHVGHLRLFRMFDEIASGAQGGPGMALIWTARYYALSLARSGKVRFILESAVILALFWLKYLDDYLIDRPGAIDAASGTFFLGRRREDPVDDSVILASYKGRLADG